jgi:hypothetical protein
MLTESQRQVRDMARTAAERDQAPRFPRDTTLGSTE